MYSMFRPNSGPVYAAPTEPERVAVRAPLAPLPTSAKAQALRLHLLPWGSNECCKCGKLILGANYTWLWGVYHSSPMACELVPDAPRKELPPLTSSKKG